MINIAQIHERALAVASRYKSAEIELIEILQLVGEHRVFYHLKYNSLFQYAVQALGLSEEVAYIFINVSRKASEVPKLKEDIQAGRISVSKAKTISPVLTNENQERWLEMARTKTKRQIEREVALASPNHAVREKAGYTTEVVDESAKVLNLREIYVELKLGVPEKLMLKLRQAQDLVSQSKRSNANLVETLKAMTDLFIQKKDPVEKAKRQKMRGKLDADVKTLVPGPVNVDSASSERTPFTAAVKNQVYLKYQGQCSHIDEKGNRCVQRRMLEIHHIVQVSQGGTNDLGNLTLLCQGHHRAVHVSDLERSSSF
jgi:5-methylcytosine-specific restriction endonuclease McrA